MPYLSRRALDNSLQIFDHVPKDHGTVESICIRPLPGVHQLVNHVMLCPHDGVLGDRWKKSSWLRLPNGDPDPRVQIALCTPRLLALLQSNVHPKLAIGDTFVADIDLSETNMAVGQRLLIGTAIIEVSDVHNDACIKFAQRFGKNAFNWIRASENRSRRLRGIFAKVIRGGKVSLNDVVFKL